MPILADEDEMERYWAAKEAGEDVSRWKFDGEQTDINDEFKKWVRENEYRIKDGRQRGKAPYFVRDNDKKVDEILEEGKESGGIKANGQSKEGGSDYMDQAKRVNVTDFLKGEEKYVDISSVRGMIDQYMGRHSDIFPAKFASIETSADIPGYFRTERINGEFHLKISNKDRGTGYVPAESLKEAFEAIAKGEKLTFRQEYAMESVWHEMLHMKSKWWGTTERPESTRIVVETLNQYCARKSYPHFVNAFGGKVSHLQEIMEKGYGYNVEIINLRRMLDYHKIDETAFHKFARNLVDNAKYENFPQKMKEWLLDKGIKNAEELMESLDKKADVFLKML